MGILDQFKSKPTLSDLQEKQDELKIQDENEALSLSIAQKKALHAKLKANGLNEGMFGGIKGAWEWFKRH